MTTPRYDSTDSSRFFQHRDQDNAKRFVAHRGANNEAPGNVLPHLPENSIHALREAYAKGAYYVECDVHMTADKKIIVIHDDTLARTARYNPKLATTLTYEEFLKIAHKKIPELSYVEHVSQVDIGAYADYLDEKYHGTRISLLEEFLVELKNHPLQKLVIELKAGDIAIISVLKRLINQCVNDYNLRADQLMFISFDYELIKLSKQALSNHKHLFLTTSTPEADEAKPDPKNPGKYIGLYFRIKNKNDLDRYIHLAKLADLDGMDVEYDSKLIDEDFMQRIYQNKLMSVVWTYPKDDTVMMAKQMLQAGANLINTNQPEYMFAELNKRSVSQCGPVSKWMKVVVCLAVAWVIYDRFLSKIDQIDDSLRLGRK